MDASRMRASLFARLRWALTACALICANGFAWAQAPVPGYPDRVEAFDSREVALLPAYCRSTQVFRQHVPNDPAEGERWAAFFGPTFLHLHHYCWGVMKTNRAMLLARERQSRLFYLGDAITEYDYVLDRSTPDFLLLPEILTKKAENLILLDRGPHAVVELMRAISLKPDYWPASVKLSDYYKSTGDLAKARQALVDGLAADPNAKVLQRRLDDLGSAKAK